MDLVLEWSGGEVWAIEIKRSLAPSLGRGFHSAREDLRPARTFVVYGGADRYVKAEGVEVLGLRELCERILAAAH